MGVCECLCLGRVPSRWTDSVCGVTMPLASFIGRLLGHKEPCLSVNEMQSEKNDSTIVVIGAGVSGLSAAWKLFRAGFKNVVILEATDRVGGRINSAYIDPHTNKASPALKTTSDGDKCVLNEPKQADYYLETGAQYIHDTGSGFYKICKALNVVDENCSRECASENILWFTENHKPLPSKFEHIVENTYAFCEMLLRQYEDITKYDPKKIKKLSVGEVLERDFAHQLESEWKNDSEFERKLRKATYDFMNRDQLIDTGAETLFDLSFEGWTNYKRDGPFFNGLIKPFATVLYALCSELPEGSIKMRSPVHNIRPTIVPKGQSPEKPFTVLYGDQKAPHSILADHIIVTVSLGVLKDKMQTMFQPPLPRWKSDVIELMGFGVCSKIFLRFNEPFWENALGGERVDGIFPLWLDDPIDDPEHRMKGRSFFRCLLGIEVVATMPNTVVAWIGGPKAAESEVLPEEELLEYMWEFIKFCTGIPIPKPIALIRHTWVVDEYYRGTYTFRSMKANRKGYSHHDLIEPVWKYLKKGYGNIKFPGIMFAGEGTSEDHYSTAHGAFETGQREADRIIDVYEGIETHRGQSPTPVSNAALTGSASNISKKCDESASSIASAAIASGS